MSYGPSYLPNGDISLTRQAVRSRPRHGIKKETLVRWLLTVMVYVTLLRATGMWYGYPSNFDDGLSVDPLPQKLILYSLIPMIGVYFVLEPNRFLSYFRRIPVLVVVVTAFTLISLALSISFGASARGIAAVTVLTIAPLLYRRRYGSVETFRLLENFAVFAAFANVLYTAAFPHFAIMGGSYAGMVKGLFYHKNMMGQFFAVAFIVVVSIGLPSSRLRYRTLLRWAALLLMLLLIAVSRSSTAVVMLATGLATLSGLKVMFKIGNSGVRSFLLFFLCLTLGFIGASAYLGAAQLIADAFGKDLTFSGRTNIWEQLIPLVYDKPIFGYGFALFRQPEIMEQFVRVTFDARSTHNTYLELALNIGVPGMIAWVAFLFKRLGERITTVSSGAALNEVQAKEVAVILMIMIGAMMEAGLMLAPVVLWPLMVVCLPKDPSPSAFRRKPPKPSVPNSSRRPAV
ncbi:O-antigen ligase family protein [Rhizobium bangladeshense]|uniref:O-antigen ligase family protein n=1 Tax=Rhizobium bangladeshense TaxID=1138189 RepID=UPI001C8373C1|nr:O-antigen ligase family protein [Rhizobium bangladeshense]MBX4894114.1 O-antigen ligase family protein [Rhizobium bangladeshense]MBX4900028.1 O-antigen ligase family protein [Rhizobium bangladeshense]MBX4912230.1 O-antigen ligase family protein [Rhizobium bangladeshense]MBY3612184.1 O-antigen ligase family protein [Rhizobium bangladeshense]